MSRLLIFVALILGTTCCKPENNGELYVSNHALDKFDRAMVTVTVDDRVVYEDTVTNKYLSFHWDEKSFPIPTDSFRVIVNVVGQGFKIKKDTTFRPTAQVFFDKLCNQSKDLELVINHWHV